MKPISPVVAWTHLVRVRVRVRLTVRVRVRVRGSGGVGARLEADVVDVRVRVVVPVARDADVELARQVAVYRVAALASLLVEGDQVVEHVREGTRVHHLVLVDAGERVTDHVTDVVKPGLDARLVEGMQAVEHRLGKGKG